MLEWHFGNPNWEIPRRFLSAEQLVLTSPWQLPQVKWRLIRLAGNARQDSYGSATAVG